MENSGKIAKTSKEYSVDIKKRKRKKKDIFDTR